MAKAAEKILIGKKAICEHLCISEPTLNFFITIGLPHTVLNNRLYAHADNIDAFFRAITGPGKRSKALPPEVQ